MPALKQKKSNRREEILQVLAVMLEQGPGERITTARLAKEVGVSEAALYRHFPSKARMFEGLLDFVEESIFSRVNLIVKEPVSSIERAGQVITLLLAFAGRNPGISRLLTGDALMGEQERLRDRVAQFFDRIEVQLKQILRESKLRQEELVEEPGVLANLLLAVATGRVQHFVRSGFTQSPTSGWQQQWQLLSRALQG